jgi:hypothetical protein
MSVFRETSRVKEVLRHILRTDGLLTRIDSVHAAVNLLNFALISKTVPLKAKSVTKLRTFLLEPAQ